MLIRTAGGGGLTATVDPARGAKITSLRDASRLEWLAQPASDGAFTAGTAFTDAEMAGWDECAPTIVACRVGDRDLPDHGDLWDATFDVEPDGSTLVAIGQSLGYRFHRRILATRDGLRFEYEAEALDGTIPFLWAAHPQFAAPPGTRVELPPEIDRVVDVLDPATPESPWSPSLATIDTVEQGGCRKLYVHPDRPVHSARLVRGHRALSLSWSPECPYLGLWFDGAAYSREPVIAIEPATGYFDALDTADRLERAPVIAPGRPLDWWIELASLPMPCTPSIR
jgi:hypothetical protein